jgi:hypothetical protein
MEVCMPRQFGLKAMTAAVPSAPAASPPAPPERSGSALVSRALSPAGSPAATLVSPRAELPMAPASWRGCCDRRSTSQY